MAGLLVQVNEFLLLLLVFVVGGLGLAFWLDRRITQADASRREEFLRDVAVSRPRSFIISYRGGQKDATDTFGAEARAFADMGYVPVSQSWAPGQWSFSAFVVVVLLALFVVGILILIYMLIVKPGGTLTVAYELRPSLTDLLAELDDARAAGLIS